MVLLCFLSPWGCLGARVKINPLDQYPRLITVRRLSQEVYSDVREATEFIPISNNPSTGCFFQELDRGTTLFLLVKTPSTCYSSAL